MIRFNKSISFFVFTLSLSMSFSQDIITADGHNMGPRKYFIEACAGDSVIEMNPYQGYSSIVFCNCMADDLLPLLTKEQINYYITEDRQQELMNDATYSKTVVQCMVIAKENWKPSPPPPEERIVNVTNQALIDSIVELVDYRIKFDEIIEDRLMKFKKEKGLSKKQLEKLKENIRFEDIRMVVIKNAYSDYSTEELTTIYDYLKEMTPNELSNSTVKYEQIMVDYFFLKIDLQIEDELK